jgi:glycosyltransferase involved in cell wall biosynthesis
MGPVIQITDKPEGGGGIRRAVEDHAALLRARGWSVRTKTLPLHDARSPRRMAEAVRDGALVQLHLGFTGLRPGDLDALRDRPLIVVLHDIAPFAHEPALVRRFGLPSPDTVTRLRVMASRGRRRAVWRGLLDRAELVIAPSTYLADLARAAGAAQVRVLPHAVMIPKRTRAPQPNRLLFVGRLSPEKGPQDAIEALALVPGTTLTMIGDGPLGPALRARAAALGLSDRITFAGARGPDQVADAIAQAALLLVPSRVPEGLGLAGIEALAQGCPVLGTGFGGAADWLVDGVTGWRTKAGANALAEGIATALAAPEELRKRGARGQVLVADRFSPDAVGETLDRLCRDILAERAA